MKVIFPNWPKARIALCNFFFSLKTLWKKAQKNPQNSICFTGFWKKMPQHLVWPGGGMGGGGVQKGGPVPWTGDSGRPG